MFSHKAKDVYSSVFCYNLANHWRVVMTNIKLEICSFCGQEAKIKQSENNESWWEVGCLDIHENSVALRPTKEEAIEEWNNWKSRGLD